MAALKPYVPVVLKQPKLALYRINLFEEMNIK